VRTCQRSPSLLIDLPASASLTDSHEEDSDDSGSADYEGDSDEIESDDGYESYGLAEL